MEGARIYTHEGPGPVGLDARPRPASMRARIIRGLKQSAPFSSLQRRIIFFNLIGLAILDIGVMYLNQFRSGLIELRVQALRTQGEIIAFTIARLAAHPLVARQAEPTAPSRKNRPSRSLVDWTCPGLVERSLSLT